MNGSTSFMRVRAKLRRMLAVLPLAVLSAQGADAADWVPYGENDGDLAYYDAASLLVDGSRRTYWAKTIYQADKVSGPYTYRTLTVRVEVDCRKRTRRPLLQMGHDSLGNVTFSIDEADSKPRPVVPDTHGELQLEEICKVAPKRRQ